MCPLGKRRSWSSPASYRFISFRHPFAGISGLELIERAEIRNPGIRFILVTGLTDEEVRRQVAKAGADAFFFKPLEMADFLDAVQECLGLKKPTIPQIEEVEAPEGATAQPRNVSQPLSRLRQEAGAICAVLIEERGDIMAQAGDLPDEIGDPALIASLMSTFSAASKVAHLWVRIFPKMRFILVESSMIYPWPTWVSPWACWWF